MKNSNFWNSISITLSCIVILTGCARQSVSAGKPTYVYSSISRGSIQKTVSSSGSLEPVSTVKVLAQMSGIVEKVYADYNDHIKKGQVLVQLNTDMLKLQKQEKVAAVEKARATYELQKTNYQNQLKLAEKQLISEYDLKSSKTTLDVDAAELASTEADLSVIETEINQYAFIKSPIDGIVLARGVDVGQSVVEGSSSNSSTIFTLAESLSQMEIQAKVDELDIAAIKKGQQVRFTVEALPGKTFPGVVDSIHLVPETTDNVVSYYVIVRVDNTEGLLLPGMTANAEFIVKSSENVLVVPNAALRYEPTSLSAAQIADKVFNAGLADLPENERAEAIANHQKEQKPAAAETAKTGQRSSGLSGLMMGPRPGRRPAGNAGNQNGKAPASAVGAENPVASMKSLWFMDDKGELQVLRVTTGVTDGTNTEIITDKNLDGKKIILKEKI